MDKEKVLQKLAEELSAPRIYDDYISQIDLLKGETIRLCVLGQPNTAKSSFINSLLGLDLPISNLPSNISYRVKYSEEKASLNATPYHLINDNNPWLKNNNVEILEINADIIPEKTTQIDLCKIISQADLCIYLSNAQSALNRSDLFVIENLNTIGIPTLVALSRMDLITDEDQPTLISYLGNNLQKYANVQILPLTKSIKESSSEIIAATEKLISQVNIGYTRSNFTNFYFGIAISQLFEICQKELDVCKAKEDTIEKAASNKVSDLNSKTTDWLKVETQLRLKTSEITEKLRTKFSTRKEDIIRRLNHDVDVCGDIKLFWEKDFPFRLDETMRSEVSSSTQMVNAELVRTMQWLQDILLKQFKCKMSLSTAIVSDKPNTLEEHGSDVSVADTQKLKIVTRIGTAATVIAAGTLLATSGIGGIIMAVSMVSGIGAEFFMRKKTNESKEHIKKVIPEIVDRAQIQIITDFNQKIEDVTNEIISQLQTVKLDWIEQKEKTIEQEKSIALFNNNSAKWDALMQRINQLAELILK